MSEAQKLSLSELRQTIRKMEVGTQSNRHNTSISTGFEAVDHALPDHGLPFGSVHEIAGTAHLGFCFSVLARRDKHTPIIWIMDQKSPFMPYAPGLKQYGLNPSAFVFVFFETPLEGWSFFEMALRAGFDTVMNSPGRLDMTRSRRVQLAAEHGASLGLLLSHEACFSSSKVDQASMSSVYSRWHANACSSHKRTENRLALTMKHCRHARPAAWHINTPLTLSGYW